MGKTGDQGSLGNSTETVRDALNDPNGVEHDRRRQVIAPNIWYLIAEQYWCFLASSTGARR
jgi:hypothetical protein